MKKLIPVLLLSILLVYFSSCEKDDICVDGDTPNLVIGFFDSADTTLAKVVPSLRIKEIQLDTVINTITDRSSNLDSIGVPLRTNTASTSFAFIIDSADDADTDLWHGCALLQTPVATGCKLSILHRNPGQRENACHRRGP